MLKIDSTMGMHSKVLRQTSRKHTASVISVGTIGFSIKIVGRPVNVVGRLPKMRDIAAAISTRNSPNCLEQNLALERSLSRRCYLDSPR